MAEERALRPFFTPHRSEIEIVTFWDSWRRGIRPADITWMPEEVELAPDWVREEINGSPQELQDWLAGQVVITDQELPAKQQPKRRGRRPKK